MALPNTQNGHQLQIGRAWPTSYGRGQARSASWLRILPWWFQMSTKTCQFFPLFRAFCQPVKLGKLLVDASPPWLPETVKMSGTSASQKTTCNWHFIKTILDSRSHKRIECEHFHDGRYHKTPKSQPRNSLERRNPLIQCHSTNVALGREDILTREYRMFFKVFQVLRCPNTERTQPKHGCLSTSRPQYDENRPGIVDNG